MQKWIAFAAVVWIVGMFLGATFEYHTSAADTWEGETQVGTLQYLTGVRNIMYQEGETGPLTYITPNPDYFTTWWQLFSWDFHFLEGEGYSMVRWIALVPFTLALTFGFVYMMVTLLQGFIHR